MTGHPDTGKILLDRYIRVLNDWAESNKRIAEQQDRQKELVREYEDCLAAARVFGLDLAEDYQGWLAQQNNWLFNPDPDDVPRVPAGPGRRTRTVKDIVLTAAREAFPQAVRVKRLRRLLEQEGIMTHEKTVGMTLYRLSRDGFVRRSGQSDWFYVPEDARKPAD